MYILYSFTLDIVCLRSHFCKIYRIRYFIRRYGSGLNFDSGTYEQFHKFAVKTAYQADCKRDDGGLIHRLTISTNVRTLVKTVTEEGKSDPPCRPRRVKMSRPTGNCLGKYLQDISNFEDNPSFRKATMRAIRSSLLMHGKSRNEVRE